MSEKGCLRCFINYHMISDSCDTQMCKKCGGKISYLNDELIKSDLMKHDNMWSSNSATPSDIDPDYIPK